MRLPEHVTMTLNRYLIILTILFLYGCSEEEGPGITRFTLLPSSQTGVDFSNDLVETEAFNIIDYLYFNNGAGVAAGDFNHDGLIDLFFTASQKGNRLYLNEGGLKFSDITEASGVSGQGDWKTGVSIADVNGDGLLDIYVCQVSGYKGLEGANQLFINEGDLKFTDRATEAGVDFRGFSTQSVFLDYDLDGDLDLFLLNHSVHSTRSYGQVDLRDEFDPRSGDRFYRNDLDEGRLHFTEVTRETGIFSSQIGYGLNVSAGDLNNDGYPDLYISNDFHENDYLYINNGDGTFTDRFTEMMTHGSRSSMGNDLGDFNNDGLLDVLVLDMLPAEESIRQRSGGEDEYDVYQIKREYGYYHQFVRNTLQLNLGEGVFSEIGRLAGIHATDWSWSPLFCDLDNDGWKDIFITNGIFRRPNDLDYVRFLTGSDRAMRETADTGQTDRDLYEKMALDKLVNYVYRNEGDFTFNDVSEAWGFRKTSYSNGSVYADLDNDGDLDLVTNNINEEAFLYCNNSEILAKKNYLQFEFEGPGNNALGIGTRVILYYDGKRQMAENHPTHGFFSSIGPRIHFGLDTVSLVDSIEVIWPDRTIEKHYRVPANQLLVLTHDPDRVEKFRQPPGKPRPLFRNITNELITSYRHREDPFRDFMYEPLMPHSLSNEGPGIAVADINGDGLDDLYLGGAAEQPPVLLVQDASGRFSKHQEMFFRREAFYEDVDAAFLDADSDGDLDLYVVSGGNQYVLPHPLMQDRLYLNDGKGHFTNTTDRLPGITHNGSCVEPEDFDLDGDIDLFLGSRSIPRAYGLDAPSYLLINEGNGYYRDGTPDLAPFLSDIGMVTDATWADLDGDSDPDLVVVGEWMPVSLLVNEGKGFRLEKDVAGATAGWWFSIESADIDRDGDEDLIAGNLGLNTYLDASPETPVKMYLNDLDGNGSLDHLVTFFKDGKEYPFASADLLFRQVPALRSRFESYADFAGRTVPEIIPADLLEMSLVKTATCFTSSIFINQGDLKFERRSLPPEAQFAPVRAILAEDLNGDAHTDLLLGGNFFPALPYYGRYSGHYGWFLRGSPDGNFEVVYPRKSGFMIKGEIRDLSVMKHPSGTLIFTGINNQKPEFFVIEKEGSNEPVP